MAHGNIITIERRFGTHLSTVAPHRHFKEQMNVTYLSSRAKRGTLVFACTGRWCAASRAHPSRCSNDSPYGGTSNRRQSFHDKILSPPENFLLCPTQIPANRPKTTTMPRSI